LVCGAVQLKWSDTIVKYWDNTSFKVISIFFIIASLFDIITSILSINGIDIVETSFIYRQYVHSGEYLMFILLYATVATIIWTGISEGYRTSKKRHKTYYKFALFAYAITVFSVSIHNIMLFYDIGRYL
jgi:hypothetical protein